MITYQYHPLSSWDDFEELCSDIFKKEWSNDLVQRYGRQGSTQHGVDIYGKSTNSGKYTAIQCKGKQIYPEKNITTVDILRELKKAESFSTPLETFIFTTTAPRCTKTQDFIRELSDENTTKGLFSIGIYFWDDIESLINKHSQVADRFYPNKTLSSVNSDLASIKKVIEILDYELAVKPIKEELFAPDFDSNIIRPLYQLVELESNPNVYFENSGLSYCYKRILIVSQRMIYLIGEHAYPCIPPKGSYVEIPYKDLYNSPKHKKLLLDTIEELISDSSELLELYSLFVRCSRGNVPAIQYIR